MEKFDLTYVTSDSLSEGVGRSQIIPLLTNLAEKGLSVHLITLEKNPPPGDLTTHVLSRGIHWTPMDFGKMGVAGGFKRFLLLKSAIDSTRLIHARSDIPALAGLFSRRAPVIWDARALWSDQRSFMTKNLGLKLLYRLFRIVERYLYQNAAAVCTLSSMGMDALTSRYGSVPRFSIVVPTSVDLKKFVFSPKLPSDVRILFSGTYNSYYDLETTKTFVDALQSLCQIEVCWAKPVESDTTSLNLNESLILNITSRDIPSLIEKHSVGISICRQDAGISLSAVMPTKIAEFLAVGRPVVINKGLGDFENLIMEFQAGVVIDTINDNLLEKARQLLEILVDQDTPRRCRALAEKHLDNDQAVESYLGLYRKILPNLELRDDQKD